MIQSWEELGDVLAEFENRLAVLENSVPFSREDNEPPLVRPVVNVTYKTTEGKTPAFKDLREEMQLLKQQLKKPRRQPKYS